MTRVSTAPVPMSVSSRASAALEPPAPVIPGVTLRHPATNVTSETPPTLRQVLRGSSVIRRAASSVGTLRARLPRTRPSTETSSGPTRLKTANAPASSATRTSAPTTGPAPNTRLPAWKAATNPTPSTSTGTTRAQLSPPCGSRRATPSGVITTRRRLTAQETSATSSTAATVATTGPGPSRSSATAKLRPWKRSCATAGSATRSRTTPSTAPAAAWAAASSRARAPIWALVAPASRSRASRSSRRATVSRAAAAPRVAAGTRSRATEIQDRNG